MHPIEMLILALAMIAQGAVAEAQETKIKIIRIPEVSRKNATTYNRICNPLIPVRSSKGKAVALRVRCMSNASGQVKEWDEAWTAYPQEGGTLVWRKAVIQEPRVKKKAPVESRKKKKKLFSFQKIYEYAI